MAECEIWHFLFATDGRVRLSRQAGITAIGQAADLPAAAANAYRVV
jgi:hypothetical protein